VQQHVTLLASTVSSSYVALPAYKEVVDAYLFTYGFSEYTIPSKLKPDYDNRLENVRHAIENKMYQERRTTLARYEIESIVSYELDSFIKNLKTIVYDYNIRSMVEREAQQFLSDKGIAAYSLSSPQRTEYDNLLYAVVSTLQSLEYVNGNAYVRDYEIKNEVQKTLAPFVCSVFTTWDREKQQQQAASNSWWHNFFFGSSNTQAESNTHQYLGQECCICLEGYHVGDRVGVLPCKHTFHEGCIKRWLANDSRKSCPLCRAQNCIVAQIETVR
jgi:hypothetical protein